MILGADYIGLAHPLFPVADVIRYTPHGYAIGTFDDVFGNALPNLRKLIEAIEPVLVRIHVHWDDLHRIVPMDDLRKKLPRYEKLAREYPTKFYISHSCEYKEIERNKVRRRIEAIRHLAPSCIPVNSCMKGALLPKVITERHGKDAKAKEGMIVSMDGDSIFTLSPDAWFHANRLADVAFGWCDAFNLREPAKPPPPIPKRKYIPTPQILEDFFELMR